MRDDTQSQNWYLTPGKTGKKDKTKENVSCIDATYVNGEEHKAPQAPPAVLCVSITLSRGLCKTVGWVILRLYVFVE